MWFNFHTHTNFCDGKNSIAEMVQTAEQNSLVSLGFSSHAPVPFDCKWCMRSEQLTNYQHEIKQAKSPSTIEIYNGLEVDYIPNVIAPTDFALDYSIGSIHFVDQFKDNVHWEIDGNHQIFLKGLDEIFNNNIQACITRYFELTREMLIKATPTVLGHLDKIKIQNLEGKFFNESDKWYQREIKETVRILQSVGTIVEVNTRGIYQKKSTTTYPSPWVIDLLIEKNIPLTISSDAHHYSDLTNQFEETQHWLSAKGLKKIHALVGGNWKPYNFSEKGIEF
ncbi:MAG: histidinol-phosphatase [Cytophagales bacterium]